MGSKHLKNAKRPLAAENRRVQIVNLSKDEAPSPASVEWCMARSGGGAANITAASTGGHVLEQFPI